MSRASGSVSPAIVIRFSHSSPDTTTARRQGAVTARNAAVHVLSTGGRMFAIEIPPGESRARISDGISWKLAPGLT